MNKKQLIQVILKEVENMLNQDIPEQMRDFKIKTNETGVIETECFDEINNCINESVFKFNWWN